MASGESALRTLARDARTYGDPKLDHGDLDADSGYLAKIGYHAESGLPRITDHSDTALQREQLRNDRVEKRELFAFFSASSLLGSFWYSNGCSENECTRVESNLREHCKLKLFDTWRLALLICVYAPSFRERRGRRRRKRSLGSPRQPRCWLATALPEVIGAAVRYRSNY